MLAGSTAVPPLGEIYRSTVAPVKVFGEVVGLWPEWRRR